MRRESSAIYLALVLVLGCVVFRLLASGYPDLVPNISPVMAVAYVGAMYLPRRWGWLVGPATLLLTDIAFTQLNARAGAPMFSWWMAISFAIYALAAGLGILISQNKSLPKIVAGSLILSLLFYVVANTCAWATDPGYAQTFAGWWQANTVGLPGWTPAWHFLRNGMIGDLIFVFALLLVLDRELIFGSSPARATARMA